MNKAAYAVSTIFLAQSIYRSINCRFVDQKCLYKLILLPAQELQNYGILLAFCETRFSDLLSKTTCIMHIDVFNSTGEVWVCHHLLAVADPLPLSPFPRTCGSDDSNNVVIPLDCKNNQRRTLGNVVIIKNTIVLIDMESNMWPFVHILNVTWSALFHKVDA